MDGWASARSARLRSAGYARFPRRPGFPTWVWSVRFHERWSECSSAQPHHFHFTVNQKLHGLHMAQTIRHGFAPGIQTMTPNQVTGRLGVLADIVLRDLRQSRNVLGVVENRHPQLTFMTVYARKGFLQFVIPKPHTLLTRQQTTEHSGIDRMGMRSEERRVG